MSYGNYYIYSDLRKGVPEITVARRITQYYPDITLSRAIQMVRQIDREGPDTIVNWKNKITGKNSLRPEDIAVRAHQRKVMQSHVRFSQSQKDRVAESLEYHMDLDELINEVIRLWSKYEPKQMKAYLESLKELEGD